MDNDPYSTWDASFTTGMPRGGAQGLPDLNFPPEVQGITEEPSNPQPGPSNPQPGPSNPQPGPSNPEEGSNSPKRDPPDKSFFRDGVVNPKPFFTGKIAEALDGMRKLLVGIRRRPRHRKEGGTPKRKSAKRGQPDSKDRRKRNKRSAGDDDIEI